jgi:hypothetical protein
MALVTVLAAGVAAAGAERTETFDRDPGWEGRNNRATSIPARTIVQDFGYSPGSHRAGGRAAGEIGGTITPAAEPAFYARRIRPRSLRDRLTASGTLSCGDGPVHVLIGFFNASTVNEWRTPNSLALRIQGRGDRFFAFVEYATARWRAGGDEPRPFARRRDPRSGKLEPRGFPAGGTAHRWSLTYDPASAGGRGSITATVDDETSVCELRPGHQDDGAMFDRFGILIVLKSADTPGELRLDDVSVVGELDGFDTDPGWDGRSNRTRYTTTSIRPRFDFGFTPSQYAGGAAPGELGGLIFRGDIRDPRRMASYGDRTGPLRLDRRLRASGRIALRRAVSDSTTLLGFYHSRKSLATTDSQRSALPEHFLGLAVEGPSREGFFVYPAYRGAGGDQETADGVDLPRIFPDGRSHRWELSYEPSDPSRSGRLRLTLDDRTASIDRRSRDESGGEDFDRFGIVTTWIDGNGQSVFFDDLTYTIAPQ